MEEFIGVIIFVIVLALILAAVARIISKIGKWISESATKASQALEEGEKEVQQPLKDPPAVPQPKDRMTNDELREHMDARFVHLEQLVANLHDQQEAERSKVLHKLGEMVDYLKGSFLKAGKEASTYLLIGILVTVVVAGVTFALQMWGGSGSG